MGIFAAGLVIGAVSSLLSSWFVAEHYFKKQRAIDKERENQDVQLSYARLVNAYFGKFRKRLKDEAIREAMSELEAKLKVYNRQFEAAPLFIQAAEQAAQTVRDNPETFEGIAP